QHFSKMARKPHKLTEDDPNTFQQLLNLNKHLIHKILHFQNQISQPQTLKHFPTPFYQTIQYFQLPNQFMTQRHELHLNP
ncbi:hypothetical protein, partial [Staphylococcus aureus]|uniref:hypothetical protein n=1 Tax=Staphylococcus aureus TaxID=1280 RepID=UPI0028CBB8A4